ncbi:DUF4010 domain-containing protein [Hyphomonas sp.]|uniref:MgtC/SapB family protein n=1 Tax=Hyphomonas sp. TaxID=87 RepID=UPI001DF30545|nr:DUF4010 domain-containing protein [Hyphomonas sp.]MBU3921737.1 DUF4010 domain-containing protein [Alphaproteobacteria bacterium]MBU4063528.1 DUF4010 domain-containing protein [Alphaproteobacteria bacterium]MBU4162798.1 DUF4010 domain-containing protein [Alphaproteobacteria bacterium]
MLQRLTAALAIGALIGIERGWKQRSDEPGSRAAGLRTFTLAGLLGGIAAVVGTNLGAAAFAAIAIAFSALFGAFQWRETLADEDFSATSTIAGLLTFALGGLAGLGYLHEAAAAAVAAVCILAFKQSLHAWLGGLTWPEIRSALLILAMTFIALPLLPSGPIDPWGLIDLRELWFLTILIATISFAGYVAVRVLGARAGLALGAVIGSLVSSTLTVAELAGRVRKGTATAPDAAAAASLSTLVMLIRIGLLVSVLAPHLLSEILPVLGASVAVSAAGALYLFHPRNGPAGQPLLPELKSPLDMRSVAGFALLIAGLNVSIALATNWAGDIAVLPLAILSGFADVDAVILNVTRLSQPPSGLAVAAILLAALANMFSKSVLAFFTGNLQFGLYFAGASLAACLAGAAAFGLWLD